MTSRNAAFPVALKQPKLDSMLNIGPRIKRTVTAANPVLNVGDNSYFLVTGDGNNPKIILTPGREYGHLLLIECALQKPFRMVDNVSTHRTELTKNYTMKGSDTMLLVWSGSRWVQVSYSKNS